jgi:hypothetical protein
MSGRRGEGGKNCTIDVAKAIAEYAAAKSGDASFFGGSRFQWSIGRDRS